MKILVVGSNGQLGRCLVDQLSSVDHETIFTNRADLDITDFSGTKDIILHLKPDLIINASAYTAVDEAEDDRKLAYLTNHHAVANIAGICAEVDCGLIHVSTDYVFDGASTAPYIETDITNPLGVYGDSKLRGERSIEASGCRYFIIRTAWVFSEYGNNFLKTMIRLGAERNELSVIGDQVGCPTYAQDLARCIVGLLDHFREVDFESDIFHYCGDEPCSWYQFALTIFTFADERGFTTPMAVNRLLMEEYKTLAPRPAYSVMNCQKILSKCRVHRSNWRKAIPEILDLLKTF
tara:strand:+ start:4332 stop:5210 length:879 start_codon:yes stop_codon:yes gene_type:complete